MKVTKIQTKNKIIIISVIIFALILSILILNKLKMSLKSNGNKFSVLPVTVVNLKKQTIDEVLSTVGTVQADNEVTVISETQGKVLNIFFKVGDYVNCNAVISQIEDEIKQAGYMTAKANCDKAKKDMERAEAVFKEKYISDSEMDNIRLASTNADAQLIVAQKQLNDTRIKAPISGIITEKFINVGSMVNSGTKIATIVNISKLKIDVGIQENDILKLKTGDKVSIKSDLYPNITFSGKVDTISVKGDSAHTFPVEISMINSSRNPLKAGMSVRVEFESVGNRNINTIPRIAIIGSLKNPQVFVVQNKTVKLKDIVIGNEYGTDIEVVSGLSPDDRVVTNGQNNLNDNSEVTVQE